jgi:hypothetical protein
MERIGRLAMCASHEVLDCMEDALGTLFYRGHLCLDCVANLSGRVTGSRQSETKSGQMLRYEAVIGAQCLDLGFIDRERVLQLR